MYLNISLINVQAQTTSQPPKHIGYHIVTRCSMVGTRLTRSSIRLLLALIVVYLPVYHPTTHVHFHVRDYLRPHSIEH